MTNTATRALLAVLGALLIQYAITIAEYGHDTTAATLATAILVVALLCLIAAVVSRQPVRHSRLLAVSALVVGGLAGLYVAVTSTSPTTDAFTFTRYAGDLLLDGSNPYAESMAPAFTEYSRDPLRPTPRVDGSYVTTYSYPAGGILAGAASAATARLLPAGDYIFMTAVLTAAGVVLYLELPSELVALAPISLLASRNLWLATAGGVIDAIWLLPLIATMAYWRRGRLRAAGVCFGLAVAAKQQPWLIAPALLILIWRTTPQHDRRHRLREFLLPAFGVFAALNLPFVVADPVAWLRGVFVALSVNQPPIIQEGIGAVRISTSGLLPLPDLVFGLLTAAVMLAAYTSVWLRPRRLYWAVWLIPPIVLFWSPRSLTSYFTFFVPVAAAALAEYTHKTEDSTHA